MSLTNLPLTNLAFETCTDIPAGTAIDQGNGMTIAFPTTGIPAPSNTDRLILLVETTNGADKTVTVKAGVGGGQTAGEAFRSGLGDLVSTVHAATGGGYIGPFSTSRYVQLDGSITLAFQSGITGWITALLLPRT